jgi:hypothetical protein
MKAYTSINYMDLSLEEVEKISKRIFHVEGRNNGLLYNGKVILSVPMDGNDGNDFTIEGYLKAFPDIVNCKDDLDKFIDIVNWT